MDPTISIVGFSVIFQMISAFLAIRLLQFQGRRTAVLIILTAIALMAFRRVISLDRLIMGNMTKIDLLPEIIALIISILFLIGIVYITRLINTHEKTTESLRKSQEVLETIIETAPTCVKLIAADGTLQRMNRAGLSMIEAESLEQVRGNSVYPLVSKDHRGAFKTLTEDVFKGKSGELEFSMVGLKGRPLWLYTHAVPLRNEKGEIISQLAITADITARKTAEENLRKSEATYRQLVESVNSIVLRWDHEGFINFMNAYGLSFFGYTAEELIGHNVIGTIVPQTETTGRDLAAMIRGICSHTEHFLHNENENICKSGERVWISWTNKPILDESGKIAEILSIGNDLTERREAEKALQDNERRLKKAQQTAHVGDWEWEIASGRVHWSDELYRIYGYTPHEIAPDYALIVEAMHPESRDVFLAAIDAALKGESPFEMDYIFFRKDGSEAVLHTIGQVFRNDNGDPERMVGIVQDITERKHAEEKMKTALWEKEILLKEIHHRVKNNLQIVGSMLRLQSRQILDEETRILFEESRNRVQAMSLIHERLYRTENLAYISFREYVDELVANIYALAPGNASHIQKHISVEDIILNVNHAIPCGLIINELVSNSLRHAFPDARKGAIEIRMHDDKKGIVILFVKDNGIGFPDGTDLAHTKTLGLQLVLSLVKQLNGTIEIDKSEGAVIRIVFHT